MTYPTTFLTDLLVEGEVSYGIVQPGRHQPGGVPVIRVKDLVSGRIETDAPLVVDPAISAKHSRTALRGGEVLLSLVGSVGQTAVVPETLSGWNVARAVAVLRPNARTTARWLHLALQSGPVRHQIRSLLNTTVQATLNLADVKRLAVPTPRLAEQQAIAEVLGALDDKIAANSQVLMRAADLARATWRAATASGEAVPLSSLARFVNGKAYTKNASGSGRVVVRIAELNSGIGGSTVYNDIEVPEDNTARPGDLLFAWSGSLTVARWFREEAIVNQHIFKVIPNELQVAVVHQALLDMLTDFKAIAADKATTMGHIQRKHLDAPVVIPSSGSVAQVAEELSSLWDTALSVERESLTLARTRDELLPLLMSGELRVRDAEKTLEDVL